MFSTQLHEQIPLNLKYHMSTPSPTLETEVLDIVKKHYRSFFMNRVHMYYRYIAVHNLLLISKSLGVPRTHLINLERLSYRALA